MAAIVGQRAARPGTRKPLVRSALLALAIEALLLAGVGAWVVGRRVVAPARPPEPMIITLAALASKPASKPAPMPAPNSVPTPASKPAPVMHAPALEPHHFAPVQPARVADATPARRPSQTVVPPSHAPSPAPVPTTTRQTAPSAPTAAQTAAATEATPTPTPTPAPTPATAPAPSHANANANANANFDAALRAAIQAALRFPESARREGASGRTLVAFVYRDRTVSEIRVVTSSGMGLLDHAAVAAVRDAECPPPPRGMEGKSLPEQLWIDFRLDGNR
jgi:protein TonB